MSASRTLVGLFGVVGVVGLVGVGAGLSGCGGKTPPPGAESIDADFSVCSGTPAVHYAPGMSVRSASGAYTAAIETAVTRLTDGATVSTAAIGYDTLSVVIAAAQDGGIDGGIDASAPGDLTMTSTSLPWMPVHMHGASTLPAVTAQSGGGFSVADIDFFMGGYWQLPLNLVSPSGPADSVLFSICIPTD